MTFVNCIVYLQKKDYMIDFYKIFKDAATTKDCEFILGTLQNVEAKLSATDISKSQGLIYVLPVKINPVYQNGVIAYNNFSTGIALCRLGNLSAGFDEKYEINLKEMTTLLYDYLKLIGGCSSDITITSSNIEYAINRMSENLDCVICDLTFTDE